MYVFQSESTLYSCIDWRDIWRLSDCNEIRTRNPLVCKRTLNHLATLA